MRRSALVWGLLVLTLCLEGALKCFLDSLVLAIIKDVGSWLFVFVSVAWCLRPIWFCSLASYSYF